MSLIQVIERLVSCLLAKLLKKIGKRNVFGEFIVVGREKSKASPVLPWREGALRKGVVHIKFRQSRANLALIFFHVTKVSNLRDRKNELSCTWVRLGDTHLLWFAKLCVHQWHLWEASLSCYSCHYFPLVSGSSTNLVVEKINLRFIDWEDRISCSARNL